MFDLLYSLFVLLGENVCRLTLTGLCYSSLFSGGCTRKSARMKAGMIEAAANMNGS